MGNDMPLVTVDWEVVTTADELREEFSKAWMHLHEVAFAVHAWPGRLGAVTPRQLSLDKKISNKVVYLAQTQFGFWNSLNKEWAGLAARTPSDSQIRSEAAVMDWYHFLPAQLLQAIDDEKRYPMWLEQNSLFSKVGWIFVKEQRNLARILKWMGPNEAGVRALELSTEHNIERHGLVGND